MYLGTQKHTWISKFHPQHCQEGEKKRKKKTTGINAVWIILQKLQLFP